MIDIRELHIGSFVKTNRGEVIRVDSISTKRQHRKLGYHHADDPYHIHYVRLIQCEPIPVTKEMLVANGFEHNKIFNCWAVYAKLNRLELKESGQHWIMVISGSYRVCVDYVHQLQVVLVMSGLGDIADNLILERQ